MGESHHMLSFRYRPEIDGLRAIAVMGVLMYHAGFGFPGGYVGVDVFFVISGFLITGIILKDTQAGLFTVFHFLGRRIRRILPAVTFMVGLVLLFGVAVLDPDSLARLAREAVAQALLLSNVHFLKDIGYFAEGAEYKPLLHTWSLAVEEQFYLIFPWTMLLAGRFGKKPLFVGLMGLGLLSFALSLYGMRHDESATFFLLPARAWELLVGALIAVGQRDFSAPRRPAEILSGAGFAMILAAMFFYSRSTPFPGVTALLPVLGAAMVIAGNKDRLTLVGRFLSWKPVVFVGLISYSLYLWHWPLLAFARLTLIEVSVAARVLALAVSFVFAVLSWKYIETPFRQNRYLKSGSSVFIFGLAASLMMLVPGTIIAKMGGLPARFGENYSRMMDDVGRVGLDFKYKGEGEPIGAARLPGGESRPYDFALLGDSHAMAIAGQVDRLSAKEGLGGLAFLRKGTPPVTGLGTVRNNKKELRKILKESEKIIAQLISLQIRQVILIGRWSAMCEGLNPAEIAEDPTVNAQGPMVVDQAGAVATPENSAAALGVHLGEMVERLKSAGMTVWILKQVPEADQERIARNFYLSKRFPLFNRLEPLSTPFEAHTARQARANAVLDALASETVHVIDPAPAFFPDGGPLELYSERAFYRDSHHLTPYGAETFLAPVLVPIFKKMAERHPAAPEAPAAGYFRNTQTVGWVGSAAWANRLRTP
ncbi:MAG: acyltransferase family protein [Kiritimatiellia bacterium]